MSVNIKPPHIRRCWSVFTERPIFDPQPDGNASNPPNSEVCCGEVLAEGSPGRDVRGPETPERASGGYFFFLMERRAHSVEVNVFFFCSESPDLVGSPNAICFSLRMSWWNPRNANFPTNMEGCRTWCHGLFGAPMDSRAAVT